MRYCTGPGPGAAQRFAWRKGVTLCIVRIEHSKNTVVGVEGPIMPTNQPVETDSIVLPASRHITELIISTLLQNRDLVQLKKAIAT